MARIEAGDEIETSIATPGGRVEPEFLEDRRDAVLTPLIAPAITSGRTPRINLSIDTGQLALIDQAATRAGMSRSAFMVSAAVGRAGV